MIPSSSTAPARADIGESTIVEPGAVVGYMYHPACGKAVIGSLGIIRLGTLIYADTEFGDYLQTGHYGIIRAQVHGGHHCAIGNHSVLEGKAHLGNGVRIMSHVYISSRTRIGHHVFIGPGCIFLNDRAPGRYKNGSIPTPCGPIIEDDVVIGGGCTILPGITIGKGSFIAAGTLVTKDIPPFSLVKGSPGRAQPLPSDWPRENSRKLTEAAFDLWHPRIPIPE